MDKRPHCTCDPANALRSSHDRSVMGNTSSCGCIVRFSDYLTSGRAQNIRMERRGWWSRLLTIDRPSAARPLRRPSDRQIRREMVFIPQLSVHGSFTYTPSSCRGQFYWSQDHALHVAYLHRELFDSGIGAFVCGNHQSRRRGACL
jgi:hypothetical protein